MLPLNASGTRLPLRLAQRRASRITTHTATPIAGKLPARSYELEVDRHVGRDRGDQDRRDDADARPVHRAVPRLVLHDRGIALLLQRGRDAEHHAAPPPPRRRRAALERAHAVEPHHGGGGIADDAACAAGVGSRDDGGQIADVHLAPEHRCARWRRRSAPRRCCRESPTARRPGRAAQSSLSSHPAGSAAAPPARGSSRNGSTAARSPPAGTAGWSGSPTRGAGAQQAAEAGASLETGKDRACRAMMTASPVSATCSV